MSQLTITRRAGKGGVAILDLPDEVLYGEQNILLKQTIRSLVEQNVKKIVLNFEDVTKIDSTGLGELVSGFATVNKAGGELKLLNLNGHVSEIMTITRLMTLFEVFNDEVEAVASFSFLPSDMHTMSIDTNIVNIKAVGEG
jgi:anti-sigma B factor antagonist